MRLVILVEHEESPERGRIRIEGRIDDKNLVSADSPTHMVRGKLLDMVGQVTDIMERR